MKPSTARPRSGLSSVALALGVSDQRVYQLLDPSEQRSLSPELETRLRECADTRELWRWYRWLQDERQGAQRKAG